MTVTIDQFITNFKIEQLIQILLLIAAVVLAVVTNRLVEQQKLTNEEKVMPWFHVTTHSKGPDNARWVGIAVERHIAKKLQGRVFIQNEEEQPTKTIEMEPFRSETAMPSLHESIFAADVRIEEQIKKFSPGERFRITVDLQYESVLGGKYHEIHWLIMEKVGQEGMKTLLSDMSFAKTPFTGRKSLSE